ncbi:MAG: hypothetical protein WC827_03535 [Candidatus Paceibacterota bacterium]|jgi:hypothetical protein
MKIKYLYITVALFILLGTIAIAAVSTFSPTTPTVQSAFYTLNNIYNLAVNGTSATEGNHVLSTTTSSVSTTSHSISEIYAYLANAIKRENLKTGVTYLGVTGFIDTSDPAYSTTTAYYASLTPSTTPSSSGYSLEDVYKLITDGSRATPLSNDITKSSVPVGTMYTTKSVYDALNSFITGLGASNIKRDVVYFGVTGTYQALLENGQTCDNYSQCLSQYCDGLGNICAACGGDESCPNFGGYINSCQSGVCYDGSVGDPCVDTGDCIYGCNLDTFTCNSGLTDQSCSSGSDCVSGACNTYDGANVCTTGAIGMGCASGAECLSSYCDTYFSHTCTNGGFGATCMDGSECSSGVCNSNSCTTATGLSCLNGYECASGICFNQICSSGLNGSSCSDGGDCSVGYSCFALLCSNGELGTSCYFDENCTSSICYNNSCVSGTDSSCGNNDDCLSGYECSNGSCSLII